MVPLSFKKYIPDFVWLADSSGNEIPSTVIESGIIEVTGVTSQGHILEGGELSQDAHRVIESAKAGKILIQVNIRNSVSNNIDTIRMMLMFGLTPEVLITGIQNGQRDVDFMIMQNLKQIKVGFSSFPEFNSFFKISKGSVIIDGINEKGLILENGILDSATLELLKKSSGKTVSIELFYKHTVSGIGRSASFWFGCK